MEESKQERDSFIFYRSFYEAISELPPKNQLEIYKAIAEYSLNFEMPTLTGISKTIFILIKPQIEANQKRFLNGIKPKRKQTGSKTEAKPKQEESESEANNNVNVNPNVNENFNEENEKQETFMLSETSKKILDIFVKEYDLDTPIRMRAKMSAEQFIVSVQSNKNANELQKEIFAYFRYKNLAKEIKHGLTTLIGHDYKEYSDSGIFAQAWTKKLTEIIKEGKTSEALDIKPLTQTKIT